MEFHYAPMPSVHSILYFDGLSEANDHLRRGGLIKLPCTVLNGAFDLFL